MSMSKNKSYGGQTISPLKVTQKQTSHSPGFSCAQPQWAQSSLDNLEAPLNMQKSQSDSSNYNTAYHYMAQKQMSTQNTAYNQAMSEQMRVYMYERSLYESLSKEIEKETNQITTMVNMIQRYRYNIKQQIEIIAYQTFSTMHKNVQADIYGSVATELALPESDMDIVVTGINSFGDKMNHQDNITVLFDTIVQQFESKILVKAQKILNTQVPIIKLKFNLSEYYDEYSKNGHTALPYVNFESIDSINPHLKVLSVDISI